MEVVPKEQYDKDMAGLREQIESLQLNMKAFMAAQPDWVPLEEAMRLTGRSRGWFYDRRDKVSLPITMQPRSEANKRTMYLRSDCVSYGRSIAILPPAHLQLASS